MLGDGRSNDELARSAGFKNAEQALAWQRARMGPPMQARPPSMWDQLMGRIPDPRASQGFRDASAIHPAVLLRRVGDIIAKATGE